MTYLLDLASNDGWLAANLHAAGRLGSYVGVDLNPDCIERAKARQIPGAQFVCGDALNAVALGFDDEGMLVERSGWPYSPAFDVVVAFEVIEHVPDPDALLETMVACCRPGGLLFVSTPCEATENGNLPRWWHVEPKGHVRVFTPESLHALLSRHGEVDRIMLGPDGVLVAQVTPTKVLSDAREPVSTH